MVAEHQARQTMAMEEAQSHQALAVSRPHLQAQPAALHQTQPIARLQTQGTQEATLQPTTPAEADKPQQ